MQADRPLILVVDDEPLIVMYLVDMLEDIGYRAIEAFDAAQAVETLKRHDDVALVLTDINMPGKMDGLDLAALVDKTWPEVSILITSGRQSPPEDSMPSKAQFLPKPYSEHRLTHALKALGVSP